MGGKTQNSRVRLSLGSLFFAGVLLINIPASPGASPSGLWGATVFVPGTGQHTFLNAVLPRVSPGQDLIQLTVTTPFNSLFGPTDPTIEASSSVDRWSWSGPFGYNRFGVGSPQDIVATNDTVTSNLTLPDNAQIDGGNMEVESAGPPLEGSYSVDVNVGGSPVFDRSGAMGFLPLQTLGWVQVTTGYGASAASTLPDNSTVLGAGQTSGVLTVYHALPGMAGHPIYSRTLATGAPVSTMLGTPLLANASAGLVTTCWLSVYYTTVYANGTNTTWASNIDQSGAIPNVRATSVGLQSDGRPFVLVATSDGVIHIGNQTNSSSNGGWPNFLSRLLTIPASPSGMATLSQPGGQSLLAVGNGSEVNLYALNQTGVRALAPLRLPDGSLVSVITADQLDNDFLIGDLNGRVYASSPPNWNMTPWYIDKNDSPVHAIATSAPSTGSQSHLAVAVGNGNIDYIPSPIADPANVLDAGDTNSSLSNIAFSDISGSGGLDIVASGPGGVWLLPSTYAFAASGIPGWSSAVTTQFSKEKPTNDAFGNSVRHVPVSLRVEGGTGRLAGYAVLYNASVSTTLTISNAANTSGPLTLNLSVSSSGPGYLHVALAWYVGSPPTLPNPYVEFLMRYSLYVVLVVGVGGGLLFGAGLLRYRHKTSSSPPPLISNNHQP